jgi:hypothetical protein
MQFDECRIHALFDELNQKTLITDVKEDFPRPVYYKNRKNLYYYLVLNMSLIADVREFTNMAYGLLLKSESIWFLEPLMVVG